jgi:hypothetical protein
MRRSVCVRSRLAFTLLSLSALLGCTPAIKTGTVTGTVLIDGNPVAEATVTFLPATGEAVAVTTASDGTFRAEAVLVGLNLVGVVSQDTSGEQAALGEKQLAALPPEERAKLAAEQAKKKKKPKLPEKYRDPSASGLTHMVIEGTSAYDIKLSAK